MTRVNYSKDVPLIDEEILDYDTINHNETGINDGRMRLPTRYDISKFYRRNKRNRGKHTLIDKLTVKGDEPDFIVHPPCNLACRIDIGCNHRSAKQAFNYIIILFIAFYKL